MPLILFVCLGIVVLIIFEVRARKAAKNAEIEQTTSNEAVNSPQPTTEPDEGCCGEQRGLGDPPEIFPGHGLVRQHKQHGQCID